MGAQFTAEKLRVDDERRLWRENLLGALQILLLSACPRAKYRVRTLPPALSVEEHARLQDEGIWSTGTECEHAKQVACPVRIVEAPMKRLDLIFTVWPRLGRPCPRRNFVGFGDMLQVRVASLVVRCRRNAVSLLRSRQRDIATVGTLQFHAHVKLVELTGRSFGVCDGLGFAKTQCVRCGMRQVLAIDWFLLEIGAVESEQL